MYNSLASRFCNGIIADRITASWEISHNKNTEWTLLTVKIPCNVLQVTRWSLVKFKEHYQLSCVHVFLLSEYITPEPIIQSNAHVLLARIDIYQREASAREGWIHKCLPDGFVDSHTVCSSWSALSTTDSVENVNARRILSLICNFCSSLALKKSWTISLLL